MCKVFMVVILKICLTVRKKTYLAFESYLHGIHLLSSFWTGVILSIPQSDQSFKKFIYFENKKMLIDEEEIWIYNECSCSTVKFHDSCRSFFISRQQHMKIVNMQ